MFSCGAAEGGLESGFESARFYTGKDNDAKDMVGSDIQASHTIAALINAFGKVRFCDSI